MLSMRKATTSVAAVALFVFTAMPVFAADEAAVTEALKAAFKVGSPEATIDLGTAEADGDDIVYTGVKITAAAGGSDATIDTLTVVAPVVEGDTLTAASLLAEGFKSGTGAEAVSAASLEVTDAVIPTVAGGKGQLSSLTLTELVATPPNSPEVKIGSVSVTAENYVDGIPTEGSLSVEGVEVPVDANDPSMAQLKELGYDKLNVSAYIGGSWDKDSSTLTLDEISVDGADAGSISFEAAIGGVTEDVIKQLQQPNPPPEAMQSLTLIGGSITYIDASLAGRLIDMQAKQMGQPKEAFVEQITGALPLMLSALQNPPFQEAVSTAVTTFLKDPKNITVAVNPEAPVGVMDIMMSAQMEPQTLPDKLKATITANDTLEEEAPQ